MMAIPGMPLVALAQSEPSMAPSGMAPSGEANLVLPDLGIGDFLGISGQTLLTCGFGVCALGLLFGYMTYRSLRDLPVHASMREVSELIWETCKTYLTTQGKFLVVLEAFIGAIIVF